MATTKTRFYKYTTGGQTVILPVAAGQGDTVGSALSATRLDYARVDAGADNYAKHAAIRLTLVSTTAQHPDLTNTAAIGAYGGDSSFASVSQIKFLNDGAQALTIAPGASNGLTLPFSSLTIAAGDEYVYTFATPVVVDGTHKVIDVTPTSGGSLVITIGGA